MALSDFMPYGAPELLEGASPRMARSTFTATGLVAAIVCCIGIVGANRHVVQEPVIEIPPDVFNPDEFHVLQPPGNPQAPVPIKSFDGNFKSVPDEPLVPPSIVDEPPVAPVSPVQGNGHDEVRDTPIAPPATSDDPPLGLYVYTDELPQLVRRVTPIYPDIAREAASRARSSSSC